MTEQTEQVKAMLRDWVAKDGGDTERTVKWAAKNMNIGGRKFWRAQIEEAMKD